MYVICKHTYIWHHQTISVPTLAQFHDLMIEINEKSLRIPYRTEQNYINYVLFDIIEVIQM